MIIQRLISLIVDKYHKGDVVIVTSKINEYVDNGKLGKVYKELIGTEWVVDRASSNVTAESLIFEYKLWRCEQSKPDVFGLDHMLFPEDCIVNKRLLTNIEAWKMI